MKRILGSGARYLMLAASMLTFGVSSARAQSPKPTIVLVHGAFAESSSWDGVLTDLIAKGYPVVAVANPLRGGKSDAGYVSGILASIAGPIVLVGHSYGGTVISNAATGNAYVKGLVFVSAFAPDAGETPAQLSGKFPGSTLGPTLAETKPLPGGGKDLYIKSEKFHAQFAADVSVKESKLMASTQRPIAAAAFDEPASAPAWRNTPSWFVYGARDLNIPPAVHAFMAKRANARETLPVEGASHVVMVSHPDVVARVIEHAASSAK